MRIVGPRTKPDEDERCAAATGDSASMAAFDIQLSPLPIGQDRFPLGCRDTGKIESQRGQNPASQASGEINAHPIGAHMVDQPGIQQEKTGNPAGPGRPADGKVRIPERFFSGPKMTAFSIIVPAAP